MPISDQGGMGYLLDPFKFPIIAEVDFTCSATEYLWQVPAGITSITAVLIGGGASGGSGNNQVERNGGGGGALRWVNGLVVQPGETLIIKSGIGGTSQPTSVLNTSGGSFLWGRPGAHSYIASNNNSNVSARAGIGGTIIVKAEGGGWDNYISPTVRTNPQNPPATATENQSYNVSLCRQIVSVGSSGGGGTTLGSYSWGTVGGGNGGDGGGGKGIGGGQDGGGGGAGGYAGDGGFGGDSGSNPTAGDGGAGGGGMFDKGGGAYGAGGGGGVGVYWGIGPNGKYGGYEWNGSSIYSDFSKTGDGLNAGGQGGSFGADGKALGCDLINLAASAGDYNVVNQTNYPNGSNGNGKRGFSKDLGDSTSVVIGSGGLYGGGGGGCQLSSGLYPFSGAGACGHVRILFTARRDTIIREYGSARTTQTRTIGGQTVTVRFYDFNPNLSISDNRNLGWPTWYNVGIGSYYNLLVDWAYNISPKGDLPDAVGLSTNTKLYPI